MKSKKSRNYGIVGLVLLALAVCLVVFRKDDDKQVQSTQTSKEEVIVLKEENSKEKETVFSYSLDINSSFPTDLTE